MQCRICAVDSAFELGEVEYYSGFSWKIFECPSCSCRFTRHDESIYNWLHSRTGSIYSLYQGLAERCKVLFDQGNLDGLRRELFKAAKYQFVIEKLSEQTCESKLLEIGCARGYLTSYFILAGYDVIGSDVSSDAIAAANTAFGDRFYSATSNVAEHRAPYDAIYHVGTIGCVGDPLKLTQELLKMLKPGGQLLFNAPNADACRLRGQLWIDAAPPPDLVTLFRPGFWRKHFSDVADVAEEVEICPPDQSFRIALRRLFGPRWSKPAPMILDASSKNYESGRPAKLELGDKLWDVIERGLSRIARLSGLECTTPSQPSPFGLFVTMTKK